MKSKGSKGRRIPREFASADEAGEFWDTHDLTEFADELEPVEVEAKLRKRYFEVEVDEELLARLQEHARKRRVSMETLIRRYLREKLKAA